MADEFNATVDVGKVYRWEMESNPTTGYNWYLRSEEGLKIESVNKSVSLKRWFLKVRIIIARKQKLPDYIKK